MTARLLIAGLALLTAVACGGGGSNHASGGVGGSGVSRGPVSAFGSIFVTGIEWNTDSAEILIDGVEESEALLQLGMVVTVEGTVASDGVTGTATRVRFEGDLEGPIESITPVGTDGVAATIVVLGVEVLVEDGVTVFDDDAGFDFATMDVGDVVEVSGLRGADGSIRATHLERDEDGLVPGVTPVELTGVVSGYTSGATSFQIGSVTVNFDPAGVTTDLTELPGGEPSDGQLVEVEGIYELSSEITATKIELEDDALPDVDHAEIEGVITRFVSLADLDVAGQPVDASGATLTPNDPALYREGVVVEVEGRTVGGVLIARELELRGFDTRISAAIANPEDIDPDNGTFVLLGIPVRTDASTQFEDGEFDEAKFSVSKLMAGDFLSVRGVENPPGTLYATRVKREEDDDVELRGFVEAADSIAGTLTILGLTVDVNGAEFEDEDEMTLLLSEFFAQLMIGDLVEVEDEVPGDRTVLEFATNVEFETPEAGEPGLPPSFFPGVVPSPRAAPTAAAMLDDLEAFGPAPVDDLERLEGSGFNDAEVLADWDQDVQDDPRALLEPAPRRDDPTAATEAPVSMVDAVVFFFERIRTAAAEEPSAAVSAD